ncbi:hypothetical protein OG589_35160 [Sphaerisporangium sp. NBC_01403]|uniref:hypothetical protein n=1 Tax=Sphaerisporangium sp. NBC_01403 TaxID=2903599 RepID=UPI003251EC47
METRAALRFGAVLASSGPVILTTFGVGVDAFGWTCYEDYQDPSTMEVAAWQLLYWSRLLLPVLLAGLALREPRRATPIAVSALGAVLAAGLLTAVALPGTDSCTGRALPVTLPWTLIACYAVAIWLILAARSPVPPVKHGVTLWTVAAAAAVWATVGCRTPAAAAVCATGDCRTLFAVFDVSQGSHLLYQESPWDAVVSWANSAGPAGLPIVVVALAATARAVATGRLRRLACLGAGTTLLALSLLDLLERLRYGLGFDEHPAVLVRWHLFLAGTLIVLSPWRYRRPTAHAATVRSLWNRIPERPRDLAVLIGVAAAVVWLTLSYFAPSSP